MRDERQTVAQGDGGGWGGGEEDLMGRDRTERDTCKTGSNENYLSKTELRGHGHLNCHKCHAQNKI